MEIHYQIQYYHECYHFVPMLFFENIAPPLNSEPGTPLYLMYVANNMITERFEIASTIVEDHFYERI